MDTTLTQNYIPVLSIAGSDPSGGAGIQQDIKTCEALGCYGMAAITALTAQSHTKVKAVFNTSEFLEDQLSVLLDEVRPDAVKIGMLPNAESVEIVAKAIRKYGLGNIVVDPIISSTSGHVLAEKSAIEAMKRLLFPLATTLTPNIPEAEILIEMPINDWKDAMAVAFKIREVYGSESVLLKGGHSKSTIIQDILYVRDLLNCRMFPTKKIDSPNTHGTGCRLSTAIACGLAKGLSIPDAVRTAKEWLTEDLRRNAHKHFPKSIDPTT